MIDPYSTHLPLLMATVVATQGTVVECGTGLYSTPLLQAVLTPMKRTLLSFDHDRAWIQRVGYGTVLDSWEDLARYGEKLRCSVAFIDCAPASERVRCIEVMERWAQIIVVHDTEREQVHNYPGVEQRLQRFKYRVEDRRRGPWTTAVSHHDIPDAVAKAIGVAGI